MKKIPFLFLFILCLTVSAQQKFIRKNYNSSFGSVIKIQSTRDGGWVILSADSLVLSKFNSCGKIEWCKKYDIPNENVSLTDFIGLRTGGFLLLTRMLKGNLSSSVVTRLDATGFILWSKSYEDFFYDQFSYSVFEDTNGNLFLYSNVSNPNSQGYTMLVKMNSNGNLLWSRFYDHGVIWGRAILTSDNGTLMRTGGIFIKTDKDGNVQWTTGSGSPSGYYYYAPVEVASGYVFTTINTTNGLAYFHKIDFSGNLLVNETKKVNYTGFLPRMVKKSNGNIACVFNHFVTGKTYPTIVELDKNLNLVYQGSLNSPDQDITFAADFCFDNNEEAVLTGNTGNNNGIFFAKMDDLYRTSCDTIIQRMNLVNDTSYSYFSATNSFTHTLNEIDYQFSFSNIIDSVTTICTVPITLDLGKDTTICNGSALTLRNNLFGIFDEFLWSTGENTPYITVNESGNYWVTAKNTCEDSVLSDTVSITLDNFVLQGLGEDRTECENTMIVLKTPSCENCFYEWNTGSNSNLILIKEKGVYWVKTENEHGCSMIDSIDIDFARCECSFYLPNAFTPNGDGINDEFKPLLYCDLTDFSFQIFDRWSRLIFSTDYIDDSWDGSYKNTRVPEGVYNYLISYIPYIKGKPMEKVVRDGRISLFY